jgi:hypothetical protein
MGLLFKIHNILGRNKNTFLEFDEPDKVPITEDRIQCTKCQKCVMNNRLHFKEILHLSVMYTKSVLLGDALCILQSKGT